MCINPNNPSFLVTESSYFKNQSLVHKQMMEGIRITLFPNLSYTLPPLFLPPLHNTHIINAFNSIPFFYVSNDRHKINHDFVPFF